jgi:hypothetical protein
VLLQILELNGYVCSMKFLTFIMSIFILALSIVPCADVDASSLKEKSKIETPVSENTQHNNMSDGCGPFCSCNCCVGFTKPEIFQINPLITIILDITYPYIEKKKSSNTYPPFQPPKA